jgi:hypothetical protein
MLPGSECFTFSLSHSLSASRARNDSNSAALSFLRPLAFPPNQFMGIREAESDFGRVPSPLPSRNVGQTSGNKLTAFVVVDPTSAWRVVRAD